MESKRLADGSIAFIVVFALLTLVGAAPAVAGQPVKVKDIRAGSRSSKPTDLTRAGDMVYFSAVTKARGRELWKTKGSAASTKLVKDLTRGSGSSRPEHLVALGDILFFKARDGQVWRTRGSASSTKRLQAPAWNQDNRTATMDGKLFWTTTSGLWVSGGKQQNTRQLHPVKNNDPSCMQRAGDDIFFAGQTPDEGSELWATDGTTGGTRRVADITPGPGSALEACGEWANLGSTVLFVASDDTCPCDRQLWKSDGTSGGTVKLKTFTSNLNELTSVGDTVYFSAFSDANGRELWKSDGTADGTVIVKDINPGGSSQNRNGSEPEQLTANQGTLYFQARDSSHGWALWKSDGSEAGTKLVRDIATGGATSLVAELTPAGDGWLFFASRKSNRGDEPFKTRRTKATAKRIKDVRKGPKSGMKTSCFGCTGRLGKKVLFVGNDGKSGWELWKWAR